MRLKTQILLSILGITVLAQVVFGFLAYRQITESRGDQLSIFLQYLNREVAGRFTIPGNKYVAEIYLEELRQKFSTPRSTLIIQNNNRILYIAGNLEVDISEISQQLNRAYSDSNKHGLINIKGMEYYWAVSDLPDDNYQLVMLEPAGNEEIEIASTLRIKLLSSGFVIIWIAVWVSLLLSSRISKQLDDKSDQLEHIALHDDLTGLPNRKLLADRLEQVYLHSQRNAQTFVLLLIDLDRFKEVNDTLGHQFGDELLKVVASRLSESIREDDTVARLGGDEFAVLLPQTGLSGAEMCVKRILNTMDAPITINGVVTESKASMGIAIYPEHGENIEILMQHADVAMYQAKKSQTGAAIYDQEDNIHSVRRLQLMHDLRYAVENRKIDVFYQPLISAINQKVLSVEALARWQHEELGAISPKEFIPMAEQMGLIRLLTFQVLEKALQAYSSWKKKGYSATISLNVSTFCLQDMSLPDELNCVFKKHSIDTSEIELEITESALMHDLSRAGKILEQLHDSGLKLAIDDFGTGFSSLNYLKKLPVDTLKIDKSFTLDMCKSDKDMAIVKTIIELGHNLGCRVVAEGVETSEILDKLILLNVDVVQGFFYSKPLAVGEFVDWLNEYQKAVMSVS
ncbi:diguanylate cyclase/phosphodiesterase (GGDEF & EAL domains) with PAS/PAC sensor(s) [hydrothermal vent metagenome]|uniref:Diguanylate cyclase/phosphodiesterase (GGDEF & EAL domains) with PAS/PAC sensor(S) n=1 Tax=hydrothermal vent metagenome TaxID=652676 RepID=A0A3B0WZ95_9ZZZZ